MIAGDDVANNSSVSENYFPIPWKKTGFSIGLHLKGKGKIAIQLSREIPSPPKFTSTPNLYELSIDFVENRLGFKNLLENNYVSKLVPLELTLSETKPIAYWFEMRCLKVQKRGTKEGQNNCSLYLGKSGFKESLIEIVIGNPFKDLHTHPTYVSFMPKSKDTFLKVSFDCLMEYGEGCAHTNECTKVDDNLICGSALQYHNLEGMNGIKTFEEDRCICRTKDLKWSSELKKCVQE